MHFHQQLLKQLDPLAALTSHDKVSLVKAVHVDVDYGSFQVADEENEESKKGNGVGLKNVIERLRIYFNGKNNVEIISAGKDQGTEVVITIPFDDKEE